MYCPEQERKEAISSFCLLYAIDRRPSSQCSYHRSCPPTFGKIYHWPWSNVRTMFFGRCGVSFFVSQSFYDEVFCLLYDIEKTRKENLLFGRKSWSITRSICVCWVQAYLCPYWRATLFFTHTALVSSRPKKTFFALHDWYTPWTLSVITTKHATTHNAKYLQGHISSAFVISWQRRPFCQNKSDLIVVSHQISWYWDGVSSLLYRQHPLPLTKYSFLLSWCIASSMISLHRKYFFDCRTFTSIIFLQKLLLYLKCLGDFSDRV